MYRLWMVSILHRLHRNNIIEQSFKEMFRLYLFNIWPTFKVDLFSAEKEKISYMYIILRRSR